MTTALLSALYVVVAGALDVVFAARQTHQVDQRLATALASVAAAPSPRQGVGLVDHNGDLDDAPLVLWSVTPSGRATLLSAHGPALPASGWSTEPTTAALGEGQFRLLARAGSHGGHLVAGESLAGVEHVRSVLLLAEVIVAPFVVVATFLLALLIGVKAAAPAEKSRRRQLELSADASHELRTPLSVIEAEVGLALSSRRDGSYYRASLERVSAESRRLRHIVDDLLWLARFDAEPPPPGTEPVDLGAAAEAAVERFEPLAGAAGIELVGTCNGVEPALVKVAPEWLDRVLGVLVDNALHYSPPGSTVSVAVVGDPARVRLAIDDEGPGIPEAEREHLFDRFHRATSQPGGAGLGLAIADAVVGSSGGRWAIGSSASGGAHMEVSWPRAPLGGRPPSAPKARSGRHRARSDPVA